MSTFLPRLLVSGLPLWPLSLLADVASPTIPVGSIDPARELIITHLDVVQNSQDAQPGGRFTLEHLLAGIAHDGRAKTALLEWLNGWEAEQNRQLFAVGAEVIKIWKELDKPDPTKEWDPVFKNAPFCLLAIVARFDLMPFDQKTQGLKRVPELRFIYGMVKAGKVMNATVIFEYHMPAATDAEFLRYVEDWHKLVEKPGFGPAYCDALAKLTDRITQPACLSAPRRLAQIRTSEKALSLLCTGPAYWNLREFRLDANGRIVAAPTAQTPRDCLAGDPLLAEYINTNHEKISRGEYEVPERYGSPSLPFLGHQATIRSSTEHTWPDTWVDPGKTPAAEKFFRNTCNGCHGLENETQFLHIFPRDLDKPSVLGKFLRPEEVNGKLVWPAEVEFRRGDLAGLLGQAALLKASANTPQPFYRRLRSIFSKPIAPSVLTPKPSPDQVARAGRVH